MGTPSTNKTQQLPEWLVAIRTAATSQINPDDISAIIGKQVELAKKGDRNAAKFVLDQVQQLGGLKGLTLVQNHYHSAPDKPTDARPGSNGKLEAMRARAAAGQPVLRDDDFHPEDGE